MVIWKSFQNLSKEIQLCKNSLSLSVFYTAPISSCWQCRIARQNVCCAICQSNSEECNVESIGSHCLTICLLSLTINSHFSHENWQACEWVEGLAAYEDVLNAIFASSLEHFCFVSCFFQFVASSFPISLSDCSLQGDSCRRKISAISEANCQAIKANTSLRKLMCPLILPASCVELFFNCIPSQLKEIAILVIFCASAGHCNTTIHSFTLIKQVMNPEHVTSKSTIEQLHHGLSRTTLATLSLEVSGLF